jgi:hypothetical protein
MSDVSPPMDARAVDWLALAAGLSAAGGVL